MYLTQLDLVGQVQDEVSQRPGPVTLLYGDAVIRRALVRAFNDVFERHFWKDHCKWVQDTLDGTTGTVVGDLSYINRYQDILAIFHESSPFPLQELPTSMNPSRIGPSSSAMYRTAYNVHYSVDPPVQPFPTADSKKFAVVPVAATGAVGFWCRIHPGDFAAQDTYIVPFDSDALVFAAAAHVNARDEDNAQYWFARAENKIKQLEATEARLPMPLNTRDPAAYIPIEWFECGC